MGVFWEGRGVEREEATKLLGSGEVALGGFEARNLGVVLLLHRKRIFSLVNRLQIESRYHTLRNENCYSKPYETILERPMNRFCGPFLV